MGERIQWQRPADCYNAIAEQDGFSDDLSRLCVAIGAWKDRRWQGSAISYPLLEAALVIAREISDARFSPVARDAKHLASLRNSLWEHAMRADFWAS